MPYKVLEKQINALPEVAVLELTNYVNYLTSVSCTPQKSATLTSKINSFLKENPDSFSEFQKLESAGLQAVRENQVYPKILLL